MNLGLNKTVTRVRDVNLEHLKLGELNSALYLVRAESKQVTKQPANRQARGQQCYQVNFKVYVFVSMLVFSKTMDLHSTPLPHRVPKRLQFVAECPNNPSNSGSGF